MKIHLGGQAKNLALKFDQKCEVLSTAALTLPWRHCLPGAGQRPSAVEPGNMELYARSTNPNTVAVSPADALAFNRLVCVPSSSNLRSSCVLVEPS